MSSLHRRDFLKRSAQLGAAAGAADLAFVHGLPALTAQDVQVPRAMVQLNSDVEPLVRLIEETPRNRVLEVVAERVRGGLGYQPILTALMLAGVRGIRPRPVGFKFHAVLVVNSAHLAALNAEDRDRWLPLFWALDNYKSSQERNRQEGDWVMPPVQDNQLPHTREQALTAFREAMNNWNEEGADRAVAALARTCGLNEVYELFWRYGARDFRDIGHKAIFAANSYRTLQTIGWRHGEPIVRSLAYALLEHEGTNPAQRDADQDRPGRDNLRRAATIRADWQTGQATPSAVTAMLATLRAANPADASEAVVRQLNDRVSPASLWDACFLCAGELLMRQPGIVGLHTVTATNALHFAYETSSNDLTRRLVLLQAAAFLTMFRANMTGRGRLADTRLDTLEPLAPAEPQAAVGDLFAEIGRNNRLAAARKTLALLEAQPALARDVMAAARRFVFAKGTDSHDYKFSSAVLEDYYHLAPAWRNRYLASSMFWLRGSGGPDSPVLQRTRQALAERAGTARHARGLSAAGVSAKIAPMTTTPPSLLERLRHTPERQAWDRFVEIYTPMLFAWAARVGLTGHDAADLVQDVFTTLIEKLPEFRYDPQKSFRAWLKTVLLNRWRKHHRRQAVERRAPGADVNALAASEELPELEEEEYRRYLVRRALALMQAEFQPSTWQACCECVIRGRPAAEVAAELGITTNAVYLARSRVLRRLREELHGLLD